MGLLVDWITEQQGGWSARWQVDRVVKRQQFVQAIGYLRPVIAMNLNGGVGAFRQAVPERLKSGFRAGGGPFGVICALLIPEIVVHRRIFGATTDFGRLAG
jgi:hypothetical protein